MFDLQKTFGKRAEAIAKAQAVDTQLTGMVRNAETFLRTHKFGSFSQKGLIWNGKAFIYQPKGEKKGVVLAEAPFKVRSEVAPIIEPFIDSMLAQAERKLGFN